MLPLTRGQTVRREKVGVKVGASDPVLFPFVSLPSSPSLKGDQHPCPS